MFIRKYQGQVQTKTKLLDWVGLFRMTSDTVRSGMEKIILHTLLLPIKVALISCGP